MSCSTTEKSSKALKIEKLNVEKGTYHKLQYLYNDTSYNKPREYYIYVPKSYKPGGPLIFVLHGQNETGKYTMFQSRMNTQAEENGFIVCYPDASNPMKPNLYDLTWNCNILHVEADDRGFLSELAKYLQYSFNTNPEHTFVAGFSNGGFMTYNLAIRASDVFKGFAVIDGVPSGADWRGREISTPFPLLHIHDSYDQMVPADGTVIEAGGWGGAPPVDDFIEYFADQNSCSPPKYKEFPETLRRSWYYKNGIDGNEVWYYRIDDKNLWHIWRPYYAELIWEFFQKIISNKS